ITPSPQISYRKSASKCYKRYSSRCHRSGNAILPRAQQLPSLKTLETFILFTEQKIILGLARPPPSALPPPRARGPAGHKSATRHGPSWEAGPRGLAGKQRRTTIRASGGG